MTPERFCKIVLLRLNLEAILTETYEAVAKCYAVHLYYLTLASDLYYFLSLGGCRKMVVCMVTS